MNACDPAHPAELRRTATVARHHDMPSVAAALDAAAERIEGFAAVVRSYLDADDRAARQLWGGGACDCSVCGRAREALREVGR